MNRNFLYKNFLGNRHFLILAFVFSALYAEQKKPAILTIDHLVS